MAEDDMPDMESGMVQAVEAHDLETRRKIFEQECYAAMAQKEHYFIATVVYKLSAKAIDDQVQADLVGGPTELMFDKENLREMQIGCFLCEKPYTRRMAKRSCPGTMEAM